MREKLAFLALERLKDPARARPHVQWLYRQRRPSADLSLRYADIELAVGAPEEAKAVYLRLVREVNPPPLEALVGLGRIYLKEGNRPAARGFLARAAEQAEETPLGEASTRWVPFDCGSAVVRKLLEESSEPVTAQGADVPMELKEAAPDAAADVRPARAVRLTEFPYPPEARRAGLKGLVIVSLLIDEMGQVMRGEVLHGNRTLGEAVLKELRRWRFEPELQNGRAVESRLTISVEFKIERL